MSEDEQKKVNLRSVENDANAIYIFADLRGFTAWAGKYQKEVEQLLSIFYTLAVAIFGSMQQTKYFRRVVKFLGDGFFAVSEYPSGKREILREKLLESISEIGFFIRSA